MKQTSRDAPPSIKKLEYEYIRQAANHWSWSSNGISYSMANLPAPNILYYTHDNIRKNRNMASWEKAVDLWSEARSLLVPHIPLKNLNLFTRKYVIWFREHSNQVVDISPESRLIETWAMSHCAYSRISWTLAIYNIQLTISWDN